MNRLRKFISDACVCTVLISLLFLSVAKAAKLADPSLSFGHYWLILSFGVLVSAANYFIFSLKIKRPLRVLLHYLLLLFLFCIVFVTSGKIASGTSVPAVLSAALIFTCLYAVIFLIWFGISRLLAALERKIPEKKRDGKKSKTKEPYKSIYKDTK